MNKINFALKEPRIEQIPNRGTVEQCNPHGPIFPTKFPKQTTLITARFF